MSSRPFLSLILSSTLGVSSALATGMLTYDAEANAHLATSNSQQTTMIGKMVDGLRKYEEMISKAQEQIAQLNRVNNLMNRANALISGSAITIANPMRLLEQFKSQIASIQANYEDLKQAVQNFDIRDKLRDKYLERKCPWLDMSKLTHNKVLDFHNLSAAISQAGKQTALIKDAQALIKQLSESTYSNLQGLEGELSGAALGVMLCETLNEKEDELAYDNLTQEESKAILRGDWQKVNQIRLQKAYNRLQQKIKEENALQLKIQPLMARLDTLRAELGVTDKNANDNPQKIQYCRENPETHTCEPILLNKDKLSNDLDQTTKEFQEALVGAQDKDAQSQVLADYNQKIRTLTLQYLREITNQLLFLNKTMAMQSNLMAFLTQQDRTTHVSDSLNTSKMKNAKSRSSICQSVQCPVLEKVKRDAQGRIVWQWE
ncbi:hypothetical protein NHP190020_01980 [Helicobacter suis]|uniref:P-type conjugative transfer protein TrbJ n=1 Tax=Helicobacter suis TaxID=104628 RepID=A0ABM7KXD4_9HELI|nr:hypothetical protein [Helicobacter suis]BCD45159.1 hypothetical protein NHP190020_01980 [Helicobacter suis]